MSVRSALGGLVAEDIMARDCPTVPDQLSLADLAEFVAVVSMKD